MRKIKIDTLGNEIKDKNPDGSDYPKVDALMKIDSETLNIGIETRGMSSLTFSKKSFAVEMRNNKGNDMDYPLLGFPKESDFIFYGYYSDKTGIRNVLAMELMRKIGHYASRTKYFELWINEEYRGVYVLMEKIKRGDNRVNIHKLAKKDIYGDDLTGGYIIKVDKKKPGEPEGFFGLFKPHPKSAVNLTEYVYSYPKEKRIEPAQRAYIKEYIHRIEKQLNDNDLSGIDIDHAVDYFLVTEYTRNPDGYSPSLYLYKDKHSEDSKLKIGVAWDFNIAMGNNKVNNPKFESTDMWMADMLRNPEHMNYYWKNAQCLPPFWIFKIWDNPEFQEKFKARWIELKATVWQRNLIMAWVDKFRSEIGDAQIRDNDRWGNIGEPVWPNQYIGETYDKEIEYLKNWLTDRRDWITESIGDAPKPKPNEEDMVPKRLLFDGKILSCDDIPTALRFDAYATGGFQYDLISSKFNRFNNRVNFMDIANKFIKGKGQEFWIVAEVNGVKYTSDKIKVGDGTIEPDPTFDKQKVLDALKIATDEIKKA